jgi:hypothetical protein
MPRRKMVILRGNSAPAGSYPDEQGKTIAWPIGALHVWAASEYARRLGYQAVVLPVPGQPQSQSSPQAKAALKAFLEDKDQAVTAFYGFSGGGYNLRHILDYLVANKPETLHCIDLVVVLGAPKQLKSEYESSKYNALVKKKPANWKPARWDVVYKTNPPKSALPDYVPKDTETHMFGPDALLAETPAGRYRDFEADDDD